MHSGVKTITACILFLSCFGIGRKPAYSEQQCNPIGRVLSDGDRHHRLGATLCDGDHLSAVSGKQIKVLCYSVGDSVDFSGFDVDVKSRCGAPDQTMIEQNCSFHDQKNCPDTKGTNNNTIRLIAPYGNALINGRPFLAWTMIPGATATSYTVEIVGQGVNWRETVTQPKLPYPNQQPAMQPGWAYKIVIVAEKGTLATNEGQSVVNLLPKNEVDKILEVAKEIKSLNLSKDEEAYLDLDKVYMSKGLLNETIANLECRVKAGTTNATIYRTLADRFLEAGLPERAKSEYLEAARLAQETHNATEFAKAQSGLKLALSYLSDNKSSF